VSSNDDKYPEPEGWGDDGFWRDPSIDSDYETGLTSPVRPAPDGPHEDPGYSYWSDGKGWENSPGSGGAGGTGPRPGDATSLDATRGAYPPGGQPGGGQPGYYGAGGGPTAVYPGGPVGPGGPGGPGRGPGGPGGPGGRGPGGPAGPGRPGGPRGKRKGDWWRRWTWKKALAVVGSAFVLFILALVGGYYYLYSTTSIPTAFAANVLDQSSTVYYSNGTTVLGTINTEDRQDLTINQIPKQLQDAAIAAEDRGFWTEGGISPTGILRAAYDDLTSSGSLSGGSTITQEFVRNYYGGVGTQQTISRKVKEIFIAQKLASSKSKAWILQNYLNVIPLGNNAFGVAAASQTYFGVPVSKLTIAQDAFIAAIIQEPSLYWQLQYRPNLIARWHYVLNGMVTIGDLTQAQADSMKFPKPLTDSPSYTPPGLGQGCTTASTKPWAAYLMQQVCAELEAPKPVGDNSSNAPDGDGLQLPQLEDDGMKIVTTISEPMEAEMYNAVDSNMAQLSAEGSDFSTLPYWALIGAELQDPSNGQIVAEYPGRTENMSTTKCAKYNCDDNTVTQAREQVGSSFKPYELSEAVQQGMNVETSTLNSSTYLCIPPVSEPMEYSQAISAAAYDLPGTANGCSNNDDFKVENDDGEIIGKPVGPKGDNIYGSGVQAALAASSNTAFTDLAHRDGTQNVVQMAADYGVDINTYDSGGSNLEKDVDGVTAVALGGSAMTVNQQAQMLATIDDNGLFHEAHIIKYWQLPDGPEQTPDVPSHIVLTPALDSQVQYAMEATTDNGGTGTDASIGLGDRPIIGKTGTTSDEQAGFFIGAIPQYAMVVGMFTSDPGTYQKGTTTPVNSLSELGGGGFGGFWPAKIWNTFALAEFNNLPTESFQNPVFTGSAWNLLGPIPKAKPKKKKPANKCNPVRIHGHQFPGTGPGCVTTGPTPTPTPTATASGVPTGIPTGLPTGLPTSTVSPTPTASGSTTPTATPTPSASASHTGFPFSPGNSADAADSAAKTESGAKAGLAVGGVLVTVLPGSLLWTSTARRRRKRRAGAGPSRGTGTGR
jgi:membrane peptidoglycan carboxypeptidase